MTIRIWFIAPVVFGLLIGCTEKQVGTLTNLVDAAVAAQGKQESPEAQEKDATVEKQGKQATFADSVAQEISAIDDYLLTLNTSSRTSKNLLSKQERHTLKSAKGISQEGKALQKEGNSYRALQKIRAAKGLMKPMMKKFWKDSDRKAILGLVNRQIGVVKQRHQELDDLVAQGTVKSRKVINARERSRVLFGKAQTLHKNGKLRRAYVQSEEALGALDVAIAVVWRDRNS